METKYAVLPSPAKPVPEEILKAYEEKYINLDALFTGGKRLPLGRMPSQYVNLMPKGPGSRLPTRPAIGTINTSADQIRLQASLMR